MISPHYTYLLVDIACIAVPFIASFHPRIPFYRHWRSFIGPCLVVALFFLTWDALFTHVGIWHFNDTYILGPSVAGLPLEEILFFICIPYCAVFSYYSINTLWAVGARTNFARYFSLLLSLVLLCLAILHYDRYYTSVTFTLLALTLIYLALRKVAFLFSFYITWLFILPFFFLSNGILTGSFLAAPVVIYSNNFNLGIRLFTIPVEDVFYGMLLLLLNVASFEYYYRRSAKRNAFNKFMDQNMSTQYL